MVGIDEELERRSAVPGTSRNPVEGAREVAAHTARLVRLELELKALELKRTATRFGIGAGFGLTAVLLAPLLVVFLLATAAAALATVVSVWLAILIVTGVLLVLIAGLAAGAALLIKRALSRGWGDDA